MPSWLRWQHSTVRPTPTVGACVVRPNVRRGPSAIPRQRASTCAATPTGLTVARRLRRFWPEFQAASRPNTRLNAVYRPALQDYIVHGSSLCPCLFVIKGFSSSLFTLLDFFAVARVVACGLFFVAQSATQGTDEPSQNKRRQVRDSRKTRGWFVRVVSARADLATMPNGRLRW